MARLSEKIEGLKITELRGSTTYLEYYYGILIYKCRLKLPWLYRLLTSASTEKRLLKYILCLPIGFLMGVALHFCVVVRVTTSPSTRLLVDTIAIICMMFGFAMSAQIRCISLLTVPSFAGSNGQTFLATIVLSTVFQGPVTNLLYNAEEAARSITCNGQLANNMTKARMDLKTKPMKNVMMETVQQSPYIQARAHKVKQEFVPIEVELTDTKETNRLSEQTKRIDKISGNKESYDRWAKMKEKMEKEKQLDNKEKKYMEKLEFRCENVYNLGVVTCRKYFHKMRGKCMKKLGSIVGIVACAPLRLTFLCNILNLIPKISSKHCDSKSVVNPGMGTNFNKAMYAADEMGKEFDVSMKHEMEFAEVIEMPSPEEAAADIKYHLEKSRVWIDIPRKIISSIASFLFLFVIYNAFRYHQKYVQDIAFDNHYVNMYFRWIDKRRLLCNKTNLLPLRKAERKRLVDPSLMNITSAERNRILKKSASLIAKVLIFGSVFLVDRLFHDMLQMIARHTEASYEQEGTHLMNITVDGTGVMAHMMTSILKGFNTNQKLHIKGSNTKCLPVPQLTSLTILLEALALFAIMEMLIIAEAYGLRMRRMITGFFYRKREKTRTLYLYNDMLKRRKKFLMQTEELVVARIRQYHREERLNHHMNWLKKKFPRLRRYDYTHCVICEERLWLTKAVVCEVSGCRASYCRTCWRDVDAVCYGCRNGRDVPEWI